MLRSPWKSSDVVAAFVGAHVLLEGYFLKALDEGFSGPGWIFLAMMLGGYGPWMLRMRLPWYNLLLLFVPIIGAAKLHEMAENLAKGRGGLVISGLLIWVATYLWLSLLSIKWSI